MFALADIFSYENIVNGGENIFFVSMTTVWLAVVLTYCCLEFLKKDEYGNKIVFFSSLWLLAMIGTTYVYLWGSYPFVSDNLFAIIISIVLIVVSFLLVVVTFCIKKRFFSPSAVIICALLGGIFLVTLMVPRLTTAIIDTGLISYIMLFASFLMIIIDGLFLIKTAGKTYLLNVVFLFVTVMVIIVYSVISTLASANMVITINALICYIEAIEFFCFYTQTNADLIDEKTVKIDKKEEELQKAKDHIAELVYINPDTSLDNIRKLEHDLNNNIYIPSGMMMLSLDNYKAVSNTMGYSKTSTVMNQIASYIMHVLGDNGHLYQTANDRFIIVYTGLFDAMVKDVSRILQSFVSQDFFTINLRPYIGYTKIENHLAINIETVFKQLELASEKAKTANNFTYMYNPDLNKAVQRRMLMETHLKNACENKTWELYFQGKVDIKKNQIMGAEALIRWKGLEGKISPGMFIPLAEELGLIVEIGKTIIDLGFSYCKRIVTSIKPDFVLNINLSAYQLMRQDTVAYIDEMLEKYQLSPRNITFEITESAFIENMDRVKDIVTILRKKGFQFSLDDFGTGYSSISYLSSFELDEVKFDREFMKDITRDRKNLIILETVTSLAKKLGLRIVTEGIETKDQLELVRNVGCDIYQGYYFCKPCRFEEFIGLVKKNLMGEYFGKDAF